MPKKVLVLVSVVALGFVVIFGSSAQAGPASRTSAEHSDAVQHLVLTTHTVQQGFVDVDPKGQTPTLGDYQVFSDDVSQNGTKVGTDGGVCTIVNLDPSGTQFTVQCQVTVSLPKGQLSTQGLLTVPVTGTPPPFKFAITGGTGSYRTAHGQITVTDTSQTDSTVKVDLILESD